MGDACSVKWPFFSMCVPIHIQGHICVTVCVELMYTHTYTHTYRGSSTSESQRSTLGASICPNAYIHTYIHTYIHAYIHSYRGSSAGESQRSTSGASIPASRATSAYAPSASPSPWAVAAKSPRNHVNSAHASAANSTVGKDLQCVLVYAIRMYMYMQQTVL